MFILPQGCCACCSLCGVVLTANLWAVSPSSFSLTSWIPALLFSILSPLGASQNLLCLLFGWGHPCHWDGRRLRAGHASVCVQLSVQSAAGAQKRVFPSCLCCFPGRLTSWPPWCGLMNEKHPHPLPKHTSLCLLPSAFPLSWEIKVKNSKDRCGKLVQCTGCLRSGRKGRQEEGWQCERACRRETRGEGSMG